MLINVSHAIYLHPKVIIMSLLEQIVHVNAARHGPYVSDHIRYNAPIRRNDSTSILCNV